MKYMCSRITIGEHVFAYCHSVEVVSTWQKLGDKATVEMPNVEGMLEKKVRPGDEVTIELGYDDLLVTEFTGYVVRVSPTTPLRIECADAMWKLKQETVSMSWKSVSLAGVLKFIAPEARLEQVPQMTLAPFRIDQVTRYQALEKINEMYGLAIYFRGPQLFCGLPYTEQGLPRNKYHFQQNCLPGNLEYRRAEDVRVKVKAISLMPNNTRREVELGDADGELHTLNFYNLTEAELRLQATEQMKRLRFDGYSGSFMAFGQPSPQHTSVVELYDDVYPERAGTYYVDQVRTTYGEGGYRRELTLGPTAANLTGA
ncbi:MAG: hypothetical protein JST98_06105 [Bacteroidetes bacterium]|nr:hypothetical protein [Bacteroidota bacterium]